MEMVLTDSKTKIGFEPSSKWVRVMFNGQFIADSRRVFLLSPGGPPY